MVSYTVRRWSAMFCYCLLLSYLPLSAQEQLGMRLERFSGIYGAALNPANTAFTPHNWEVSLLNAGLFFENSYGFAANTSIQNLARNSDKIRYYKDTIGENVVPDDAIFVDFYDVDRPMRAVALSYLGGPSASFRVNEKFMVGLTTGVRGFGSMYDVSPSLRGKTVDAVRQFVPTVIPSLKGAGAAWGEIGFHFNMRSETNSGLDFAVGVTPKLLIGLESGYVRSASGMRYTKLRSDSLGFTGGNLDAGFTTDNIDLRTETIGPFKSEGLGGSIDIGVSWAMPDGGSSYRWRFGVALLDLGAVSFGKSAQVHQARFDSASFDASVLINNIKTPVEFGEELSSGLLGSPTASLKGNKFRVGLPTALSIQGDLQIAHRLYVGGLLIQRVPLGYKGLRRANTLAVAPRFEHRWFSISTPVTLNDWQSPRFGVAARLAYLYLGSDNLGSFFKKKQLSGFDFYIGLKINGFSSDEAAGLTGGRRGRKRDVECYSF
jgi:Family of unknown function (DUF5723)